MASLMKFAFPAYETPPDLYRFSFPDGTVIRQNTRADWLAKIRKHYTDNSYPMPEDWAAQAEHQLCMILPAGFCKWETGEHAAGVASVRLTMGDLFRGMEVLLRIAASPEPLVAEAEAERRAAICAGCPMNVEIPGCAPCMKIPDMVASIAGARTTKHDHLLRSCAVCRCRNSAQIHIKEEILAKGVTPEMHGQFQSIPWCWKREVRPA